MNPAEQISLTIPSAEFMNEFLTKAHASKSRHEPWTTPPLDETSYNAYLERIRKENQAGFFITLRENNALVGVININEIVMGCFCSGYLGYYGFTGYEKQGLMSAGLQLVIDHAFNVMGLHRLEANIQPENTKSIQLATRCHFAKEGYSEKYLNINNEWKDHIRYALTFQRSPGAANETSS